MPPESLSTLAVINPGPRTARNSSIRIRQRFHMPFGFLWWIHFFCLHDHNRPCAAWRVTNSYQLLSLKYRLLVLTYFGTLVHMTTEKHEHPIVEVERVQTGVRLE